MIEAKEIQSAAKDSFLTAMAKYSISERLTDFIIRCGGREWKVHKVVIASRSEYFRIACDGGFKEAKENEIELREDDARMVDKMLHFIYHFDYDDERNSESSSGATLVNVQMFGIGEKYSLDDLRETALVKFWQVADREVNTKDFSSAIEEAYTNLSDPDNALKNALLEIVVRHATTLLSKDTVDGEHVRKLLETRSAFAVDLSAALAATVQYQNDAHTYRCPKLSCSKLFRAKVSKGQWAPYYCMACGKCRVMPFKELERYKVEAPLVKVFDDKRSAEQYMQKEF